MIAPNRHVRGLCSRFAESLACLLLVGAAGCSAKVPDGIFACARHTDCPSGLLCRDGLCFQIGSWLTDPVFAGEAGAETPPSAGVAAMSSGGSSNAGTAAIAAMSGARGQQSAAESSAGSRGMPTIESSCPVSACQPGGVCQADGADYHCECARGFSGTGMKSCSNIDYCPKPDPCEPGGTCVDQLDTYTCKCEKGYELGRDGHRCVNTDDCPSPNPCSPGACIDGLSDYHCQCQSGFSGTGSKRCLNIDDCPSTNECSPGGRCVDAINTWSCDCDGTVPAKAPANSCRFTLQHGGIYDAKTGLVWADGFGMIYKDSDSPLEYCDRTKPGSRPPSQSEVNSIIEFRWFACGNTCHASTGSDVCGPYDTPSPELHCVYCVLKTPNP